MVETTNIWTFEANQSVDCDKVETKTFKPTGKFFEDTQFLARLFNVRTHPGIRESSYNPPSDPINSVDDRSATDHKESTTEKKDVVALNFYKYRVDKNTMKITFMCLPYSQQIQTLKFQNNGFTIGMFNLLLSYMSREDCPVLNLFFDWNPIYQDEGYTAGDTAAASQNKLYVSPQADEDGEQVLTPFAKLVESCKRLQVLFLRASGLQDRDLAQICQVLKPDYGPAQNKTLKVLDLSYNTFSGDVISDFVSVFETNRTLEYLGLAKNGLTTAAVAPLLKCMGKVEFSADQVEAHQDKIKQRNTIIEQNKKKRTQKKPEEPVPIVDNLEPVTSRDADGNEVTHWYLLRCPQFKHLNLCMNNLDEEILPAIQDVLRRTADDFGFTLTGNHIEADAIKAVQNEIEAAHKKAVQAARNSDPNSTVVEQEDIAYKRCAF